MKVFKSVSGVRHFLALAIPLSIVFAADSASAQSRNRDRRDSEERILEWQGQVDREIRIQITRNRASVIEVGSNERARRRVNVREAIPNRPGTLHVEVLQGRGRVDVIQQPTARNGYTAVIRLRDPDGGASRYRIAAFWEGDRRFDRRRR